MKQFTKDGVTYKSKMQYFKTIEPRSESESYHAYYMRMQYNYDDDAREKHNNAMRVYEYVRYNTDPTYQKIKRTCCRLRQMEKRYTDLVSTLKNETSMFNLKK